MGRIGIVVLHWNNAVEVKSLCDNLHEMALDDGLLFIVDNSLNMPFRPDNDDVFILRPPANLGFAGGCNMGIQAALSHGCSYLLLLNADIRIDQAIMLQMKEYLNAHPECGAVAPVLRESHASQTIYHKGGRNPIAQSNTRIEAQSPSTDTETPVYLPGTVLMIRNEAWSENGPFDEEYFFSGEVADWFLRLASTTWRFKLLSHLIVDHLRTGNEAHRNNDYVYYSLRNRYLLMNKFGGKKKKKLRKGWTKHLRRQMIGAMGKLDLKRYKTVFQAARDGRKNRFGQKIKGT